MKDPRRRERSVALPAESRLAAQYADASVADAFAIVLTEDATQDIEALARAVLDNPASWMTSLMKTRDSAVRLFGIKTSTELRARATVAGKEKINFFRVHGRWENELVVGDDDRHLDFRVSVLIRPNSGGAGLELVTTTVVQCHNLLGRAYLIVIMPFHRAIVRSNLHRAAKRGWPQR